MAVIVIKWSKILQDRCNTATVAFPVLPNSPLCQVDSLLTMSNAFPASCYSTLFQVAANAALSALTDSRGRKHLKGISASLGLQIQIPYLS